MIKKTIFAITLALLLSACTLYGGNSSAAPVQNPSSTTHAQGDITIMNFAFSPQSITVKPGQTVTIVNNDSVTHTFTSDDGTSFNTNSIEPGATATITAPSASGTYGFHCNIHKSMTGTLIVQ